MNIRPEPSPYKPEGRLSWWTIRCPTRYFVSLTMRTLRLRALLLLGMVLGGLGLPALDAVVYHGAASQAVSRSSVAAPGTPVGHAVLCSLADQLASTRSLASSSPQPCLSISVIAILVETPSSPRATYARFSPALPRAPPLSLI